MERTPPNHIEVTTDVLGGKPRIAGSRIRVIDIVFCNEKRGFSPDEILSLYPALTLADVYAALAYYFDHREEVEASIRHKADTHVAFQARYPSKLQAKLHSRPVPDS